MGIFRKGSGTPRLRVIVDVAFTGDNADILGDAGDVV